MHRQGIQRSYLDYIFEYSIQRQAELQGQNGQQQNSQAQPLNEMSQERKQFLEAAIKDYVKDEVERMREIKQDLDTVQNSQNTNQQLSDEQVLVLEQLLEELSDILCSMDYARDFNKIGGLPTLLFLLEVPYPSLRQRAAEAIATSAQNNPPAQEFILESGAMQNLIYILKNDKDTACVTKALLAVSALVRHNDIGLRGFLIQGGIGIMTNLLTFNDEKTQRKTLFLFSYIFKESQEAIQSIFDTDLLQLIKGLLKSENYEIQENSLDIINIIVQSAQGQLNKDKLQKFSFQDMVDRQVNQIKQNLNDDNQEILKKYQSTQQLLKTNNV